MRETPLLTSSTMFNCYNIYIITPNHRNVKELTVIPIPSHENACFSFVHKSPSWFAKALCLAEGVCEPSEMSNSSSSSPLGSFLLISNPSLTSNHRTLLVNVWRRASIHLGTFWARNVKLMFPLTVSRF